MENDTSGKTVKILIALAVLTIAVAIGAYVYFTSRGPQSSEDQAPTPTEIPITPTPTEVLSSPTPTATSSAIPEDWETYSSTETGFSLSHPPDMEISTNQDGSISFSKLGPTQTEGTELFDGISLNIESGDLSENSFSTFVENRHEEAQDSPVSEIGELTEGTLDGKTTYQYIETGLGVFTHIYIPFEENSYVHVSLLVEDPSGQGFEETAEKIISSIDHEG